MHEQFFRDIREGMDVYDLPGDKVGTIGKIYQPAAVRSTAARSAEPAGTPYLQVDTGFLGLGKDLFIPASAVAEVTGDQVVLSVGKERLDTMGWDRRPDWLREEDV
jgi:hypothetical protein